MNTNWHTEPLIMFATSGYRLTVAVTRNEPPHYVRLTADSHTTVLDPSMARSVARGLSDAARVAVTGTVTQGFTPGFGGIGFRETVDRADDRPVVRRDAACDNGPDDAPSVDHIYRCGSEIEIRQMVFDDTGPASPDLYISGGREHSTNDDMDTARELAVSLRRAADTIDRLCEERSHE